MTRPAGLCEEMPAYVLIYAVPLVPDRVRTALGPDRSPVQWSELGIRPGRPHRCFVKQKGRGAGASPNSEDGE